jgi:hypothetical protein
MLSHHSWDKSMQRLDGIIDRCLASLGRTSRETRASAGVLA